MIIHSPIISGSLTFADGGTFTLPDNGIYSGSFSGSIQVHQVKSHLVPDANEVYDLGSSTNRFRDIYLSNNTINFPGGGFGFGNNGFGFTLPSGDPAPIVTSEVKVLDEADGSFAKLSVVNGALTTTAFDPFGVESAFDMKSQLSGSFTGSFLGEILATNGVVSGSSQVVLGSVTGFNTFSSSIADTFSGLSSNYVDLVGIPVGIVSGSTQINITDTTGFATFSSSIESSISTEKGRIDSILLASDANKDSFAEIVTLINSVDTTNDNAFASFYTASNDRFDNIEGFTASIDTTIKTKLDAENVFSSSAQIDVTATTNYSTVSSHISSTSNPHSVTKAQVGLGNVDNTSDANKPVSTATQTALDLKATVVALNTEKGRIDELESFSSSLDGGFVTEGELSTLSGSINSTINTHVGNTTNPHSVTKGQVGLGNVDNTSDANKPVSTAQQTALDSKLNIGGVGVVSGSSQIDVTATSGYSTVSSHIASTSNPHSVTKAQVGLGNADNTSDVNKPISTATQTALDGKQVSGSYVTTTSAQALSSAANALTLVGNTLTLSRGDSTTDTVDLSAYLDEDSRAIASGTMAAETGIVTFTRDDASTFTLNLSALLDDTNLVTSVAGKSGVVTLVKGDVGLGNVDNTADSAKPVSTAQQTALDTKLNVNGAGVISGSAQILSQLFGEDVQMGDITGSNLYLSGNAVIAGNVTIGNAANDTISFAADVSSDILPSATNTYDLGSATDKFAEVHATNLYGIVNGTINSTNGVVSGSSQIDVTATTNYSTVSSHISSSSNPHSVTATQVGLGNVTNESKATMFSSPSFTGTVSGVTSTMVGLGNVTNESKATMFSSPTFTGTVSGVTATHVGLGNVTNESKATMFTSPTLTGTTTVGSISFGNATTISNSFANGIVDISVYKQDPNTGLPDGGGGISIASTGELTVGSISFGDATIATASGTLGITATSGISLLTSGGGDGVTIAANGNTTIYGALALQDIATSASSTAALVVGGSNVVSQRTLGSNAFTSTAYATAASVSNVDNTSDADKPVSTAQQSALNLKANLTSPTFTGTVIAPTPTTNDSSTKVATTAYVQGEISDLIGGAGAAFDTLLEISASIANGDSDVVALTTTVSGKLQKDQNLSDLTNAGTARTNLGLGSLATLSTVNAATITDNSVGAAELNVTGNGTTAQFLRSDGDGTFTWATPTTYSVGNGGLTEINFTSALNTKLTGIAAGATNVTNNNQLTNGAGYITGISSANVTTALGFTPYNATNPSGYTTYTSNQATNTTSAVTFASVAGGTITGTSVSVTGDVVAYSSSDSRLKDNVKNIENAIEKVQSLNGVTWDWNDNADELQKSIPNVGVIAQEVEQVLPQLVKDRENGYKGVDYAKLTGLLIEAIKEQQVQIDELKSKLG